MCRNQGSEGEIQRRYQVTISLTLSHNMGTSIKMAAFCCVSLVISISHSMLSPPSQEGRLKHWCLTNFWPKMAQNSHMSVRSLGKKTNHPKLAIYRRYRIADQFFCKLTFSEHTSVDCRQQDVRSTEIDKVDMHLSFRPGDVIRAEVVSSNSTCPLTLRSILHVGMVRHVVMDRHALDLSLIENLCSFHLEMLEPTFFLLPKTS